MTVINFQGYRNLTLEYKWTVKIITNELATIYKFCMFLLFGTVNARGDLFVRLAT